MNEIEHSFNQEMQHIKAALLQGTPLQALELIDEMSASTYLFTTPKQRIELLSLKSKVEDRLGQSSAVIATLNEALSLTQDPHFTSDRLQLLHLLSDQLYTSGHYREAIQYWLECIELGLELGDITTAILAFISIGGIFNAADEHQQAYALHQQVFKYCTHLATPKVYCTIRLYLAADAMWLRQPAAALLYLDEADLVIKQHHFINDQVESHLWRGQSLLQLNRQAESIAHLNQGLAAANSNHYAWGQLQCHLQLGLIYSDSGRYCEAEAALLEAQAIAQDNKLNRLLCDSLNALSALYEKTAQAKQALLCLQAAHSLERQLSKTAAILELEPHILKQLAKLEVRFNLAVSQQENLQLRADHARQTQQLNRLNTEVFQDPLTGLANRRWLDKHLPAKLLKLNEQEPFSILLLDLDHFKAVNDDFSHLVGDEVLRHLGEILQQLCREADTPVRFGGEEFLITLQGLSLFAAAKVAERIRTQVLQHAWPAALKGRTITLSAGVAQARHQDNPASLIERADQALYRAKNLGRNRVELQQGIQP